MQILFTFSACCEKEAKLKIYSCLLTPIFSYFCFENQIFARNKKFICMIFFRNNSIIVKITLKISSQHEPKIE